MTERNLNAPVHGNENRWIVPLAAILIHVCIGSVYAWNDFNRPINAVARLS